MISTHALRRIDFIASRSAYASAAATAPARERPSAPRRPLGSSTSRMPAETSGATSAISSSLRHRPGPSVASSDSITVRIG